MKGYYIEITNNLLDPKHRKIMKESIWLFMWFLDKMTSISEKGFGRVLGGKPIIYEEIKRDLDISRRTYTKWIDILRNGKYIETKRTPIGLVIVINKAKKRFNNDVQFSTHHNLKSDVRENVSDVQENVSDVQNTHIQFKTGNKDIIQKQYKGNFSSFKKKPYFYGMQIVEKLVRGQKRKYCIPTDGGEWLEFAGKEEEIEWR